MNNCIHFDSFVEKDGYIYLSDKDINALYRCNINDWRVESIGSFPDEGNQSDSLHGDAILLDGKILFSPMSACGLHLYDFKNKSFSMIEISDCEMGGYKYVSMLVMRNKVYLFPFNANDTVIIDLENLKEHIEQNKVIRTVPIRHIDTDIKVSHACGCAGDIIYLASSEVDGGLVKIDSQTDKIEYFHIDGCMGGCEHLFCIDDENILLASKSDNRIYRYMITSGKKEELLETGQRTVIGFADCGREVIVALSNMEKMILINKNNFEIRECELLHDEGDDNGLYYRYIGKLKDGRLIIASKYDRDCTMMLLDVPKRTSQKIALKRNVIKRGASPYMFKYNRTEETIREMFADDLINYLGMIPVQ